MAYSNNAKKQFRLLSPTNQWVVLLEITHAALPTPMRFVVDTQSLISQGNRYQAIGATIELPAQQENQTPQARLVLDNVSRPLVRIVEDTYGLRGARVKIIQVFRETPDVREAEITLTAGNISIDQKHFACSLVYDNILDRPGTPLTYRPSHHPGLF